ncbi:homing endonuclease associated repeat-containing protein [Halorubrum sp. Atlit-26R]|uniref:homing endonuclease associated repeat-containing protein n=1 Tax=Halorubrum sp. Atlit-26R TaxID=2282128 RepID=UPI0011C487D5|nr:hypothetical protein [Halorubrum sp. Atlit-26R]
MTRGEQHSDEELIEDIKRVSDLTGRAPPTKTKYTEHGKYSPRTVQLRFGSWNEAVMEAGFEPRSPVRNTRERPSTCPLCESVDTGLDFHHWRYGENETGCYLCRECHDTVHKGDGEAKQPGWLPAAIENLVDKHLQEGGQRDVEVIVEMYNLPDVDDLVRRELESV